MAECITLAIIVVNYNSYNNTIKCIKSILENPPLCKYKVYIVDNGSTNNSYEYMINWYKDNTNVCVCKTEKNKGYSGGLNFGIKQAIIDECKYFLLCNNDLLFPPGSLDALVNTNEQYPNAGVVGGRVIGTDGALQKCYKRLMSYKDHLSEKKPFMYFVKDNREPLPYDEISIFDGMVSGACFMLSRNTIEKIGLLDENIFLFYEEDALAYMMKNAELKAIFNPYIDIVHFGSTTIGTNGVIYYLNRYKSSMYVLKRYAHINNLQLGMVYFCNWLSLRMKSTRDDKYKVAVKELKTYYHKLMGIKRD